MQIHQRHPSIAPADPVPHLLRRFGRLFLVFAGLLPGLAATLVASEPTVAFNGWTNIPGVFEGTLTVRPIDTTVPAPPLGYLEYLPKGYNPADTATRWPLVVFVSGEGEVGDGTDTAANGHQLTVKMERHGPFHLMATAQWDFPAVVVALQSPGPWNNAGILLPMITYLQARYNVDNSHLYLTGLSGGADGVLNFASSHQNFMTAINAMSCGLVPSATAAAAVAQLPMWIEHCYNDPLNARTNSIAWIDQAAQDDIGSSDVMGAYPGYAGTPDHEAVTVSSTSGFPADRAGPTTVITGCTLTNGSAFIAFGSPNDFGSAAFNSWGGTDAQPYACVNLGATTPDTTPSNNIIAIGKADGVYLTQPFAGASATQAITIQIPNGLNETAFDDLSSGNWTWEGGDAWDRSMSGKRILTMFWYQSHQEGWIELYGVGDFWDWMFTQSQTVAPAITSPTTYTVNIGSACSFTVAATNGPTGFTASPLPAGLAISPATGQITGSPTATGATTATLSASNAEGTGYAPLTIVVMPPAPTITSATAATATLDLPFNYTITASGNPTSFAASPLPPGISFDATAGVISGNPTATGASAITLSATNASGTGTATLDLTVNPPAPAITSATAATVTVGSAFSYQIIATNNPTSYTAAPLPPTLALDGTSGLISGTVTTDGATTVMLGAGNPGGTGTANLTITVQEPVPAITSALSVSGTAAIPFSYQIAASGHPTFFTASGLPSGLALNTSTGLITGTAPTAGTTGATISAINATGTGAATLDITIDPASSGTTGGTTSGTTTGGTTSGTTTSGTTTSGTTTGGTTSGTTTGGTTSGTTTSGTTTSGTTGGTATSGTTTSGTTGGTATSGTTTSGTTTGGTTASGTTTGGTTSGTTTASTASGGTTSGTTTSGTVAGRTTAGSGTGDTVTSGGTATTGTTEPKRCGLGAAFGALLALVIALRRKPRRR